jgi:hypothetical protein
MSGAIPLLPLYTFIAWTRKTLPFRIHDIFSAVRILKDAMSDIGFTFGLDLLI